MWVKICANTSVEDAQMAVDLGVDAVGFVFAPSPRQVMADEAGQMTAQLRGAAECIGVFPDWEFEAVLRAVRVAGLTGVQMHGEYKPELLRRLRSEFGNALTIAQTLHWEVVKDGAPGVAGMLLERVREMVEDGLVDRVLVDSKVGSVPGGTGQVFDWEAAEALFAHAGTARMIVAGGLRPENVGEAIGRLRPWGVDVASGVESGPGKKDPERLRLFVERARAAGGNAAL